MCVASSALSSSICASALGGRRAVPLAPQAWALPSSRRASRQHAGAAGLPQLLQRSRRRHAGPGLPRTAQPDAGVATAPATGPGSSSGVAASGNGAAPAPSPPPSSSTPPPGAAGPAGAAAATPAFSLQPIYVLIFSLLFLGGLLFASMSLHFTTDLGFGDALAKVTRRILRSIAFRQLVVITACMFLVRFALNNVLRFLAQWSSSPVQWDKSKMYYVMKEVYSPLELLLFIAGCCTIADSFVPQLINVPKATVTHVVRAVLSMSFVMGAAVVVYNLKSRFCKEQAWQCEMQGDVTSQRRWEAYDKLGTFGIYVIGTVLVIQALGLEVRSVLAIGGIGGLAIGLAGREICENLLNGFLLMTTMPFEVGEEILFRPKPTEIIEGIVVDVGWYRTLIRSFEREMYVIPNAVFSKNTVLNVSRKAKEWRFYEYLCVRVGDVHKTNAIVQDIRRIVRNDARIINKLHRRVFLDKITMEDCKVYLSFYVEASNRDAFMAVKQDLLLAFVDCVERNGAKLAQPRTVFEMDPESGPGVLFPPILAGAGLLPGPGGTGAFGGRGSGLQPITVQVVDAVEATATPLEPPSSNGSGSSNGSSKEGAAAAAPWPSAGRESSSSSKVATSSSSKGGGGGGTGGTSSLGRPAAGSPTEQQQQPQQALQPQQQPQQQQQSPPQPAVQPAGVGAQAAAAAAAAARGRGLDAAGMAAVANAQRKGDATAGSSNGGGSGGSSGAVARPPSPPAVAAGVGQAGASPPAGSPAAAAAAAAAVPAAAAKKGSSSSSTTTATATRAAGPRPGQPFTVVAAPPSGSSQGPAPERADAMTILASFEEL